MMQEKAFSESALLQCMNKRRKRLTITLWQLMKKVALTWIGFSNYWGLHEVTILTNTHPGSRMPADTLQGNGMAVENPAS